MKLENIVSTTFLIALLTVVLFVGVWQIKPIYATESNFGYTSVGGTPDTNPACIVACKFTAPSVGGSITKISAYIKAYSNPISTFAVIYLDSSETHPQTNLANSTEVNITSTSLAWTNYTISYSFSAGLDYWFGIMCNDSMGYCLDAGITDQLIYTTYYNPYPNNPSDWSGAVGVHSAYEMSIYATYTPSSLTPSFSGYSQNTTLAGQPCQMNVTVTANHGTLSKYIFSFTNGTSTWTNETDWTTFGVGQTSAVASVTHRLNVTINIFSSWCVYANNTDGLQGISAIQSFYTTGGSCSLTIESTPIAVSYGINSSEYTFPSWTVSTPVTASGIESAITSALVAGGTVYIPSGDWRVDQQPIDLWGVGGAIPVNLESLPNGAWLNIIGLYTNTTVITQNGQTLTDVPNVILRSYTVIDHTASFLTNPSYYNSGNNLTQPYATFGVLGSNVESEGSSNMQAYKSTNRHIRISGLTILGDVQWDGNVTNYGSVGINIQYVDGYLIDHCAIDSQTSAGINTWTSKGIISNCTITQLYHLTQADGSNSNVWGYGIGVSGNMGYASMTAYVTPTWIKNITNVIGKYDWQGITLNYTTPVSPWNVVFAEATTNSLTFTAGPVYIENSLFKYTRHAASSSAFSYYVFRYNTIFYGLPTLPMLDLHGGNQLTSAGALYASRGSEIYNNTIIGMANGGNTIPYGQYGMDATGGASLIFNNTIIDVAQGIQIANRGYDAGSPNDPEYIHDTWIWDNSFTNIGYDNLDISSSLGITVGVDLFYDDCGSEQTPTTPPPPKTGYLSYAWPHPLTLLTYIGSTNVTLTLTMGTYLIVVPETTVVGGVNYAFDEWEDSSTNTTRLLTLSSTTTIIANYVVAGFQVIVSNPSNTTYTISTIPVSLFASGGTIDTIWWNCKNGTSWIYGTNQTYTTPTSMTGFVDGASYTFYAWANNTDGNSDEETVMFTVTILVVTFEWGGYWGRWWGYP